MREVEGTDIHRRDSPWENYEDDQVNTDSLVETDDLHGLSSTFTKLSLNKKVPLFI